MEEECTHVLIISMYKITSLPDTDCNIFFHGTVLLLIYFCYQFVTSEIRRSKLHYNVCQQLMWYSARKTKCFKETLYLKRYISKRLQTNFLKKAGHKAMSMRCEKIVGYRHS